MSVPAVCERVVLFALRYTEKANNVEQEEALLNIQFVTLDCTLLKSALVQHCREWKSKFTQLLSHTASTRLKELLQLLQDSANRWGHSQRCRQGKVHWLLWMLL